MKVQDRYRKRYIWCLVNREEKIVIYCYEEGSRSRDALKNILGDRQIRALQSDGYNVYMYLEDRLYDTEHLCCLAHARAKFVYAYEQGGDLNAKQMLEYIGWLYGQEDSYRRSGLTAEEITRQRNSLRTKEVIGRMLSILNVLTEGHPPYTLLSTCRANGISALAYLKKFFREVVKGRRDYENLLPMTIGINTNKL